MLHHPDAQDTLRKFAAKSSLAVDPTGCPQPVLNGEDGAVWMDPADGSGGCLPRTLLLSDQLTAGIDICLPFK